MPSFDANTLMLATAVSNGFMALVWLVLGLSFKISPRASYLLAAANLLSIPGLYCKDCVTASWAALGPWVSEWALILSMTVLALGVRQLMRLPFRFARLLVLIGTALLGSLLLKYAGRHDAALALLTLAMSLLALTALADVLKARTATQALGITLLLCLPYALWALMLLGQTVSLLLLPEALEWFMHAGAPSVPRAWADQFIFLCWNISLIGMVLARLIARIKHMTLRDPLTDALNRRALDAELRRLQAQVERGQTHCLLMIDVDFFKRINDQHGHACGDAALHHLVLILRANMRALDQLGRMGGEEFCILLPDTQLPDALRVAQRMAQALRSQPLSWQGQALHMTASFGVAPCLRADPQGEQSLALADGLLYQAKSEGRDRVCVDPLALQASQA